MVKPKKRLASILLALFLGPFGLHNFYAGYDGRAICEVLIFWGGCLAGILPGPLLVLAWILNEAFTVREDYVGSDMVW